MKNNNLENLVWIVFAVIGAFFAIIGIIVCLNIFDYENKIEITGIISDISSYRKSDGDRGYQVYVSYSVDGEEYESVLNGYSSSFYKGKEIKIYYDKENPNEIGMKSFDLIFLIFPGIGTIFVIIGGIGIVVNINKKKIEKKLRENGNLIYANYVETVINTVYSVNGRHPYNIICEWNNVEDNKKYLLKSKNIWLNPENIIKERNIESFPVYMSLNNKKQYIIDTDILTDNVIDLR